MEDLKRKKLSRRQFLGLGLSPCPRRRVSTGVLPNRAGSRVPTSISSEPTCRFVQFSDLHYKGDAEYAAEVVGTINPLAPEFVCFTGDLVEDARFAPAALDFIRQIHRPVYGCPGNWDYNSGADFKEYEKLSPRPAAHGWRIAASCCRHDLELIGMGLRGVHASGRSPGDAPFVAHPLPDSSRSTRRSALRPDSRRPFAWRSGANSILRCAGFALWSRPLRRDVLNR